MEKDNRKYRICFIDYMWYVAEIWHERERTNLNGRMLLFWCWLFVLLIPLGVPPILRLFGWMIGLAIVIPLCFLPDLFCKLRYTAGRREALREHYGKMKHPGRKLAKIVLIAIALIVARGLPQKWEESSVFSAYRVCAFSLVAFSSVKKISTFFCAFISSCISSRALR